LKHDKVVIWGYEHPLTHTCGYFHRGWFRAFNHLGIPTYWIGNQHLGSPNIKDVFKNALVITDAYTSRQMPLDMSSTYMIHCLGNRGEQRENPGADYFRGKVGKLYDLRFLADNWPDYTYVLDRSKAEKVGLSYLEKAPDYPDVDAFYVHFGTDLLPHEISLEDRFKHREKYAFFAGTIRDDNRDKVMPFVKACEDNDVPFKFADFWRQQVGLVPIEAVRAEAQKALLCPDFRNDDHIKSAYISPRVTINISFGQLGITNSKPVYEFYDGNVAFHEDTYQLFHVANFLVSSTEMIRRSMEFVRDNMCYLHRAIEMEKILE
jgi:hypothetical protein